MYHIGKQGWNSVVPKRQTHTAWNMYGFIIGAHFSIRKGSNIVTALLQNTVGIL